MAARSLGVSEAEVRKLVISQPVLGSSVEENLRPTVAALRLAARWSEAEVRKLVLRQPAVLGQSIEENVRPTVAALRSLLGLSEAEVRKLVISQPAVLGQASRRICGRRWRRCGRCSG